MGLFAADQNSPEFKALTDRWNGFLQKVQERHDELMSQAQEGLKGMIEGIQYDTVGIHNVLSGLKFQMVDELGKKLDEGWKKMRVEMEKVGASSNQISLQSTGSLMMKNEYEKEFGTFEIKTYADAARQILANVKQHINENKLHRCSQCGAELPIHVYSFMSVNIKCESCGSVNTYIPDDRVKALEYNVLNHLADEYSYPERLKAASDKDANKEYLKKYYGYLMENVPDKKEYYQRAMDESFKKVDNNPRQWGIVLGSVV